MKYLFTILLLAIFVAPLSAMEDDDSTHTYSEEAYRLFSPVTYDDNVTRKFFSVQGDTTSLIDRTLMQTYLRHPELIQGSVRKMEQVTKEEQPVIIAPVKQTKMVDQVKALTHQTSAPPTNTDFGMNDAIKLYITKPNFWSFSGDYSLQFMQNHISDNWYNSGDDNLSLLGAVTLQYNYNNKQKVKWDNKLEMRLGFLTTNADTTHHFKTSDDLLRLTTQLSLQAHNRWYYALQLIASTQFMKGFKNNDATVYSDFMSPFNLNFSLGMNYSLESKNKKISGNILISPLSYKLTYSDRLGIATRFGIEEGHHAFHSFGALLNASITWKPLTNFKWESRIYSFTDYKTIQFECENTLSFQFNRYISTKLYIYPRFDNAVNKVTDTYWQFKENLSIGFSYSM